MPSRRKCLEQPLLPLEDSPLTSTGTLWWTSPSYQQFALPFSATAFHSVTDALLENPNLSSSHLFRADIVLDSTGILKTNKEKEDFCRVLSPAHSVYEKGEASIDNEDEALPPLPFARFELRRTILRRLIPRNPQLDRSLLQTCHIYTTKEAVSRESDETIFKEKDEACDINHLSLDEKLTNKTIYKRSIAQRSQHLVVYQPHADPLTGSGMPWYHPPLKFLAFLYDCNPTSDSEEQKQRGSALSIHFQFFQGSPPNNASFSVTDRTHRTMLSLLSTYTRLTRNTPVCSDANNGEEIVVPTSTTQHIKDNIIPEHLIQNTYSKLKTRYALDLNKRWIEKTDPSKHVFEDLLIAAFLLELWRKMYGNNRSGFPGFVDLACGNGVLVYVLIMEGFRGWGFDARVRRTWSIFPESVTAHLKETVCVPRPFLEALNLQEYPLNEDLVIHDGIFEAGTFIISNHADELTIWTPLLAALSSPESPLPWLAIPCCSHALSGAAHRYRSSLQSPSGAYASADIGALHGGNGAETDCDEQPKVGDLTVLRASKEPTRLCSQQAQLHGTPSTYASLVNHVMCLAKKADPMGDVQKTLMRIPSTRNIGVLGGQLRGLQSKNTDEVRLNRDTLSLERFAKLNHADLTKHLYDTVEEECRISGGIGEAAKTWMTAVQKARGSTRHTLVSGQGL